ncbi:TetR/AcrR family transcriptional regulator [Clostridium manihotivorum]|uniref:TetR/AcrR family transcriptional regulator n=1 Tax=Clostridium manihotivorum TaxID=2320868 RepID=A0A3R5TCS8_9CLOT|nr:TetR/AcrR family transcriptional regulator [Clostridium manihotivorum]QAA30331.1 TetR/AcrR family transcriptional regulator [Clostridium manihotivorum]
MNKTKRIIFEAAISIFSKAGYNGATMDEIALEAGVAKGTLYYHFKSKEEIFNFIITEGINLMHEEIDQVKDLEGDALFKLKEVCKIQLSFLYKNKEFFKVIMSQLWGQELRQFELRNQLQKYVYSIEVYIKEASDTGLIRKGDTSFLAYAFFGSLISAAIYEILNIDKINLENIIDNLIDYNFRGLQINKS